MGLSAYLEYQFTAQVTPFAHPMRGRGFGQWIERNFGGAHRATSDERRDALQMCAVTPDLGTQRCDVAAR
jgi:hypothetical protein